MSSAAAPTPAPVVEVDALPVGTRFNEFEIVRMLGAGGFGIVYLAHDHALDRPVALKEYMPATLATRGAGATITVRSGVFAETYAMGLRSFINEARLLARFDHPSLVKVYRVWEDNATAYMVMPYLQGSTLRDVRQAMTAPPDEAWMRAMLHPILDALDLLHREGVFHRDVAPDNILLPPRGQPVLLDFGAARRVIGDRTQTLTAILKPSYAPIEQYAEMTQLRQGAWTDLYGLGAVMYFLLFGQPPAPATARAVQDAGDAIEDQVVPGVSRHFMEIVAWMLAVRPHERPQHAEALRAALDGRTPIPLRQRTVIPPGYVTAAPVAAEYASTQITNADHAAWARVAAPQPATTPSAALPPMVSQPPPNTARPPVGTGPALVVGSAYRDESPNERVSATAPVPVPRTAAPVRSSHAPLLAAGLSGVAVLLLGAFWFVIGQRNPSLQRFDSVAPASAPAVVQPAPAPVPAPVPPRMAVVPTTTPAAEAQAPVASSPPMPTASRSTPPRPRVAKSTPIPTVAPSAISSADTNPAPAADEPVAPPVATDPATAVEACAGRNFISEAICMDRECERPAYRDQPACVRVLDMKRSRQRY